MRRSRSSFQKTELKAIMWSNYFVPMKPSIEEFEKATGIRIGNIKDLSTPTSRRRRWQRR